MKYILYFLIHIFLCLSVIYANSQKVLVVEDGKVGIGVGSATPSEKLEVANGDVVFRGNLEVDSHLTVSGNVNANGNVNLGNLKAKSLEVTDQLVLNISDIIPPGVIMDFAGATAPVGWLLCDGQAIDRVTYARLFSVLGTSYGAGDGSTTFNLPDLRGRTTVGSGQGTGLSNRTRADTFGQETKSLSAAENGAHGHSATFSGTALPVHGHPATLTINPVGNHAHGMDHGHNVSDPGHSHAAFSNYPNAQAGSNSASRGPHTLGGPLVNTSHAASNVSVDVHTGLTTATGGHTHSASWSINSVSAGTPTGTVGVSNSGSGQAFNLSQPSMVLHKIIKF